MKKNLVSRIRTIICISLILAGFSGCFSQGPAGIAVSFMKDVVSLHYDEAALLISERALGGRQAASYFEKEKQAYRGMSGFGEYVEKNTDFKVLSEKVEGDTAKVKLARIGPDPKELGAFLLMLSISGKKYTTASEIEAAIKSVNKGVLLNTTTTNVPMTLIKENGQWRLN